MKDGPVIAQVAALVGDPARANMLTALMDGRALTVTELAVAAGVALPTASGHLYKLSLAKLLVMERQGRHRYYRLADHDVAHVLEALMGLAQRTGAVRVRTGPRDVAMRTARVCYDHLAGRQGVLVFQSLIDRGWLEHLEQPVLTAHGHSGFTAIGIDIFALERGRRPLCRTCLDWSERRYHLGGALGAAMLSHALVRGWARRAQGRVVTFSQAGAKSFNAAYGISEPTTIGS